MAHCSIMSPDGLIINNELFTMRVPLIMRLIVPQVRERSRGGRSAAGRAAYPARHARALPGVGRDSGVRPPPPHVEAAWTAVRLRAQGQTEKGCRGGNQLSSFWVIRAMGGGREYEVDGGSVHHGFHEFRGDPMVESVWSSGNAMQHSILGHCYLPCARNVQQKCYECRRMLRLQQRNF